MADETAQETVEQDPSKISDEDLAALIQNANKDTVPEQAELPLEVEQEEPESAEVEEPELEDTAEADTAEAKQEEEQPSESEPEDKEADDVVTPPTAVDLELLQAQLELARADIKHQETIASRHGGEVGFLNRQLADLKAQNKELMARLSGQTAQTDESAYEPQAAPAVQEHSRAQTPLSDGTTTYLVGKAIQEAGAAFVQAHPEVIIDGEGEFTGQKVLDPLFMEEYSKFEKSASDLTLSPDPTTASERAHHLLNSAYSGFNRRRALEKVKALERKRADTAAALKQKKRAMAISTSSGKAAAPKKKTLDVKSMSDDDLKAAIQRQAQL